MSQNLHVCKICGKWFATAKAVYGHQRMHSGLQRIWGFKKPRVCSISTSIDSEAIDPLRKNLRKATSSFSLKQSSSFMTEFEEHEMNEAAMSLVMFSKRVSVIRNLPPGGIAMDLEKIIHCVDQSKQEFSEVSTTCSDVVAQALPSPLRSSKSQTKCESNFSYRIKICGKSFERSLGGHQKLRRSYRGQLARKKEEFEDGHSLSVLTDSGAKKVVPQPSCFEVSQEEMIERRDTTVKEHCIEPKQDFSEVFSHSGFEKSSSYSDAVAEALPFPLRSEFQETPESDSSYKCKTCGKSFGCFQALGGHQRLHRSINGQLGHKEEGSEDVVVHRMTHQKLRRLFQNHQALRSL